MTTITPKKALKVINLWAGPGAGKSTTAAGLFNIMKRYGHRVELVTEAAKDMQWLTPALLDNKLLVLAEQEARLHRLTGKVDWVITDSPLPLGIAYLTPEYDEWLPDTIWDAYEQYTNLDVWIDRAKPYATYGRSQSECQALALDAQLRDIMLDALGVDRPLIRIKGDHEAPYNILQHLDIPLIPYKGYNDNHGFGPGVPVGRTEPTAA